MAGQREQILEGRRYPLLCFTNAWDPEFFTRHDCSGKDDVSAVETEKKIGSVNNELTIFLQVSEDLGRPCEADEVKRYCEGVSLKDLEDGVGEPGKRRAAWLDDRNCLDLSGSGNARLCDNRLTATGLLRYLKQPRYKNGNQPDAERRLIYIADLTPEYILALAVTASFHQVPALRDAICKHVAFQPSIRAIIPSDGHLTFQLEFHLPFFALRKSPPPKGSPPKAHGKPLREWKDLSFLKEQNTEQEGQENLCIYQAQISCVVCGLDDWQWVAYAFVDTEHDKDEGDDDDDDDDDNDSADKATSSKQLDEDPIACGLDASLPIWKPRQYFLKVFEIRAKQAKQEWVKVVRKLVLDINEYKRAHPFTWSDTSRNTRERAEEMKKSFNWTLQTMDLLSDLHGVLSEICEEWNTFSSLDMDIGYFSDLDECPSNSPGFRHAPHAGRSLRSIKETFERLRNLRQKLVSLRDDLTKFSLALQLRLSHEGNEAVEHNGFTSEFSVWVLYPMTLAASIYSMQPSVIPFGLTPVWFCITVFILMGGMFVIHRIMKKWSSWQKKFALWMKVNRLEETDCGLARERNEFTTDLYRDTTRGDLESLVLGTRALLGRRRNEV